MSHDQALAAKIEKLLAQDLERVATIERLVKLDADRVVVINELVAQDLSNRTKIEGLLSLDADRVATIESLQAVSADHTATIERLLKVDAQRVASIESMAGDPDRDKAIERLGNINADHVMAIERLMALDAERVAAYERSAADSLATIERLAATNSERVATINRLVALDASRVATIDSLSASDAERVATIERLCRQDVERVAKIEAAYEMFPSGMDGITAMGRNLAFLDEPGFKQAWTQSAEANKEGWPDGVADVRWRAHVALWAARNALKLDGDFVECGVHTGLWSLVICHALEFGKLHRTFYLCDTFNGIPLAGLSGAELEKATASNRDYYHDVWSIAQRNFAPFPNAKLIRGALPGTLQQVTTDRISYLCVDLNIAATEKAVIEALWDKLVPGACVVIDDYAWLGHEQQYEVWNEFARRVDVPIVALPTGQGLLIKR